MIYRVIGKVVVKTVGFYVGQRYGRALRISGAAVVVGLGVAAYLASRNVPEG
jgi:NO-binding membrane sensor protein with MHYT domain